MDDREKGPERDGDEPKPAFGSVDTETRRRLLEGADRAAESLPSGRRRMSPPKGYEPEPSEESSSAYPEEAHPEAGSKGGKQAEE